MQRKEYYDGIEMRLNWLVERTNSRAKQNILDLNIHAETFFEKLLNVIYDLCLENLNKVSKNAKGVDLIDRTNKIAFQVTSTATTTKINNSIKKLGEDYQGYTLKFMFIGNGIHSKLSKKSYNDNSYVNFDPANDIFDVTTLLSEIIHTNDIHKIEKIYTLCESEIPLNEVERNTNLIEEYNYNKVLSSAYQYNKNAYSEISILSVQKPIGLQSLWIPLEANIVNDKENENLNLDSTIERYQNWYKEKRNNETTIDSFTFGRFIKKCVVIGGAGIGKTTLFRKLALDYSDEGYFVLFVKLSKLTDMLSDSSKGFEECLISCAFDRTIQTDNASVLLKNAVILADGLDECFQHQPKMIQYFSKLSKDYPESRILISTRPIGYKLSLISDWRRYELKPIDDNEFESAVKQLSTVISPEVSIDEAVLKQIKTSKISHLVKRNPLILSLVIVLVQRGIEANTNYASLYRQLFSLIEKESSNREVSIEISEIQLQEFLYLLGWIILRDGYKPLKEVVILCYEEWREELQLPRFQAIKLIENCIEYWVAKGIIERVNDLTDETVLFIHKTLGEYAAAEYLKLQSIDVKEEFILSAFSNSQYSETLTFLSHLGLSSKILELWNEKYSANNRPKDINIYEFILNAGIDYNSDEIDSFINLCWEITEDSFSTNRYTSGAILCHIAKYTWNKIELSVEERIDSVDNWVSFIALNCKLTTQEMITLKDINVCIKKLEKNTVSRKNISIRSYMNNQTISLKNNFIKLLLEKTLDAGEEDGLEVLESYLNSKNGELSIGLILDINKIYSTYDKPSPNYGLTSSILLSKSDTKEMESVFSYLSSPLYKTQERKKSLNFFKAIAKQEYKINLDFKKMFELSALVSLSGIMEMYPRDLDVFIQDITKDDARHLIFISLANLVDLNYEYISNQAGSIIKKLMDKENELIYPIHRLPKVDIELQFENKLSIELLTVFKEIILTSERFLIANACRLFLSYPESESFETYLELIKDGQGLSLSYIGAMSEHYQSLENTDKIQKLFLEKLLRDNLVSGCEYLYQYVREPYNESHIQVIIKGLNSTNPIIAIGATELLDKMPLNLISLDKVKELYLLWKDIEEPYPVKGGTVPHTPRENLAKILIKYHYHDEIFIQQMMLDMRPDIKKQAIQPFVDYCKDSSQLRYWFVGKVERKEISADLLKKCITEGSFLKDSHLVLELLNSESAGIRENALGILNTKYCSKIEVEAYAKKLLNDEVIEIRQFAKEVLERDHPRFCVTAI